MSLQPHEEERFLYPIYAFLSVLLLQLSLGAFLIFSETSIIPRTILGWFWFYSVSEVNGIGFCHHFLFLNTSVWWIDDGIRGLLPLPFNSTLGGNATSPPYFNNKNRASDEQYLRDLEACSFLVELQLDRPYPTRGSDLSTWEDELPVRPGSCWRVRVLVLERVVPQRDGQPADTG